MDNYAIMLYHLLFDLTILILRLGDNIQIVSQLLTPHVSLTPTLTKHKTMEETKLNKAENIAVGSQKISSKKPSSLPFLYHLPLSVKASAEPALISATCHFPYFPLLMKPILQPTTNACQFDLK